VVVLEPKARYRSSESGELLVAGPGIGSARELRAGADVAIATYGAMTQRAVEAADRLAESSIQAHVLDLRTLAPLDVEAIVHAVTTTGRLVVVHEAPRSFGVGAEVAALAMEHAWSSLRAPVERVTGYDTPYPPGTLEARWLPSVDRICAAVGRTLA